MVLAKLNLQYVEVKARSLPLETVIDINPKWITDLHFKPKTEITMRKHKANTYRCVSPETCGLHAPQDERNPTQKSYLLKRL